MPPAANPMPKTGTTGARSRRRPAARLAGKSLVEATATGQALAKSLRVVLNAPARLPTGASALSARLKVSRMIISRIKNALKRDDSLEVMMRLPGPESLRGFVVAMGRHGVALTRVKPALAAIDRFQVLIRDGFGTRDRLQAAISSHSPSLATRVELVSRQRLFAAMRELRGGEAEVWLAAHMLAPDRDDPSKLNARILQGFIGLRRMRADIQVYFDFMPAEEPSGESSAAPGHGGLEAHYANPPARLEVDEVGRRKVFRLASGPLGNDSVCDMLSLTRITGALPRLARSPGRRTGSFALIKTPVKALHLDILLPGELTDGSPPELLAFVPGPRCCTNVNDRLDDLDRVPVPERVEVLESGADRFDVPEVPNYCRMLAKMADELGQDLDAMRVHRVRVAYPPFGYEFVSTFRLRSEPEAAVGDGPAE